MQAAVPVGVGAMAALLGADVELAQRIADAAAEGEVCTVANDNDPSQVVISGHKDAIDRAIAMAKDMGAKRAVLLPVSAPFHCPLMQPAADAMAEALGETCRARPHVPLYANVTAAPEIDPDVIRALLVEQVTGMVRWRESVAAMAAAGVEEFVELGGKVLGPMVKRIAPEAKVTSVVTIEDIEALAKESLEPSSARRRRTRFVGGNRHKRDYDLAGKTRSYGRMMFDLTGMTALVTGASGGLGRSIAKALAGQGARLAVSGSNAEKLEAFRAELGGDHVALACNLSDGAAVDALVPQAVEALGGKLDILVNNAGVTRDNLAMRMKDEEWDEVIRVNLEAAFRLMRAAMQADDARALRPDHLDHLDRRRDRQSGPGQLCRVEGRADRHVEGDGAGSRQPRHHHQLRRAGLHDLGDDRCVERCAEGSAAGENPGGRNGQRRRHRRRGRLPRQPRGRLRHRADAPRQWRDGDAVKSLIPETALFTTSCLVASDKAPYIACETSRRVRHGAPCGA